MEVKEVVKDVNIKFNLKELKKCKRVLISLIIILSIDLSADVQQVWALKACIDMGFKKRLSLNQEQLNSQINIINLIQS